MFNRSLPASLITTFVLVAGGVMALSGAKQSVTRNMISRTETKRKVKPEAKQSLDAVPIIYLRDTWETIDKRPSHGVFVNETPTVREVGVSDQFDKVQWAADHRSLLVSYKSNFKDKGMAIQKYNRVTHTFDAPVPIAKALAKKGVHYDIFPVHSVGHRINHEFCTTTLGKIFVCEIYAREPKDCLCHIVCWLVVTSTR